MRELRSHKTHSVPSTHMAIKKVRVRLQNVSGTLQIMQHSGIVSSLFFSFNFLYDNYHYPTSYIVYLFLWLLSAPAP